MNLIIWLIFGALVGWIASLIAGTNSEQGALANIIVGIIGAVLGGFISNALGMNGVTGFNISSFLISLAGAVLLIFAYKAFTRRTV